MIRVVKYALWALGGLVGLIVFGVTAYDKQNELRRTRLHESVQVTVTSDLASCNKDYPLVVGVKNNHNRTLKEFDFYIDVYEPGISKPLNNRSYEKITWNRIVAPGEIQGLCFSVPDLRGTRANNSGLIFQIRREPWNVPDFYESGEFVPDSSRGTTSK
jgi:hypothetical protein